MKETIRALLSVTPIVVVIAILAYIVEELLEDFISEQVSDFVYPVTALIIFALLWYRVVPSIRSHYLSDHDMPADTHKTDQAN
jgi:hypothetical protein